MGIFDFFLSEDRRIAKEQRTLTNRDKQTEDREAAARWLADREAPKALVALLTRFDMNLENQLKDKSEKELVYALLIGVGEPVVRPLERHLARCKQVATPLRLYIDLVGLDAAIEKVFEILRIEHEKDDFKPQKKHDLLIWLVDHQHERCIEVATPFLEDFDENVRYAAAEVMIAQRDDAAHPILERALANPSEESNRLRVRLSEAFQQRRWIVSDRDAVAAVLPETFALTDDGRIIAA
ncbi:MAG TPA: hypothetical protein ENK18_20670 [Deltaproteobacteria bacterium]|nr:hypothetical protein [Deltaproteobacteria bacterium]